MFTCGPTLLAGSNYGRLTLLSHVTETGTGPYTYTADSSLYASGVPGPGGVVKVAFASGIDGYVTMTMGGFAVQAEPILGITPNSTLTAFNSMAYALYGENSSNTYKQITSGTIAVGNGAVIAPINGDIMRMRRSGTSMIAEVARSGSPTSFTVVHTWTGVSAGVLYADVMVSKNAVASNITSYGLV